MRSRYDGVILRKSPSVASKRIGMKFGEYESIGSRKYASTDGFGFYVKIISR